jgi:DNA-binding MarR family transcriptional regulator
MLQRAPGLHGASPAPDPSRPALDGLLLFRLNRLMSVAGSMVTRLCEGRFGITRREWRMLAALAHRGELGSSQLAEHAQLDRARTSRAIGSLVDKGLVARTHPVGDRRQALLRLTESGGALYAELFPLVAQINAQLMSTLGPQGAADFDAALARLQAEAEGMVAAAALPKADRRRGRASSRG